MDEIPEAGSKQSPFEQAVRFCKMKRRLSPVRYNCIKEKLHLKLKELGIGNFSEEDIELIIHKVNK